CCIISSGSPDSGIGGGSVASRRPILVIIIGKNKMPEKAACTKVFLILSETIRLPSEPQRKSAWGREGIAILLGKRLFPGSRSAALHLRAEAMASRISQNLEKETERGANSRPMDVGHSMGNTREGAIQVCWQQSHWMPGSVYGWSTVPLI